MGYNAIVLTQESQNNLLNYFSNIIPNDSGWIIKAHHITIGLGPPPEEYKDYLNEKITATINGYGINDRVVAANVDINHGIVKSKNDIPHITLAVHDKIGAKPKESNDIKNWQNINDNIVVEGIYKELK